MAHARSQSTPSRGVLPAMALMEVLTAAAILGATFIAFFAVLTDAQADLAAARANTQAVALAQSLLDGAKTNWRTGPYSGARAGFSWRLSCASANTRSPRLSLIECRAEVRRAGFAPIELTRTWAEPHPSWFQP